MVKAVAWSQSGALGEIITPAQPGTRAQVGEAQGSSESGAGNSGSRACAGGFPEGQGPSADRQARPQSILAFPQCFSFLLIFSLFQCSLPSHVFIFSSSHKPVQTLFSPLLLHMEQPAFKEEAGMASEEPDNKQKKAFQNAHRRVFGGTAIFSFLLATVPTSLTICLLPCF